MRRTSTIYIALTFAAAAAGLGVALTATAEPAARQQVKLASVTQPQRLQRLPDTDQRLRIRPRSTSTPPPFLFSYTFNQHLKVAGGDFTVGGQVYLVVKFNNGTFAFRKTVTAQPHSITPGGAIYVETPFVSPCAPFNNGYAQAYDYTTKTWSSRLPVPICVRID